MGERELRRRLISFLFLLFSISNIFFFSSSSWIFASEIRKMDFQRCLLVLLVDVIIAKVQASPIKQHSGVDQLPNQLGKVAEQLSDEDEAGFMRAVSGFDENARGVRTTDRSLWKTIASFATFFLDTTNKVHAYGSGKYDLSGS